MSDQQETSNNTKELRSSLYTEVPTGPLKSISAIGFAEEMNPRHRRTMEDGHCMIDQFGGEETTGYFAIYDGHGGRAAVEHVQSTLHERVLDQLKTNKNVVEAVSAAYSIVDDELKEKEIMYNGTTSITCIVRVEDGVKKLYALNCGDARVVLSRKDNTAVRLTYDHKASDESETKRIRDTGGFVAYNRVNGILSVTRALGDHAMKEWVICTPYSTVTELNSDDKFLILACDGLWDVFSDQEAVDFAKEYTNAQEASQELLEKALELGSTDNISVMVIYF